MHSASLLIRLSLIAFVVSFLQAPYSCAQEPASPKSEANPPANPAEKSDLKSPAESPVETPEVTSNPVVPKLTKADVDAALETLEANPMVGDAEKATLRGQYALVTESLQSSENFAVAAESFKSALEIAPRTTEENLRQLKTVRSGEDSIGDAINLPSDELRKAVDVQRIKLQDLKDLSTKTAEAFRKVESRALAIVPRQREARAELTDARTKWDVQQATKPADDSPVSPSDLVQRFLDQANWMRLKNEVEMLHQEEASQRVRKEELESRQELLAAQIENEQSKLDALSNQLSHQLSSDLVHVRGLAESAAKVAPQSQAVQDLVQEINLLADQFEMLMSNLKAVAPMSLEVTQRLEEVRGEYNEVRNEMAYGSGGGELAKVLLELSRRAKPDAVSVKPPITVEQSRLAWFAAKRLRREQGQIEKRFANSESDAVNQLVIARRDILQKYQDENANLTNLLVKLKSDTKQYQELCGEVDAYVSESLFGFRILSCAPISFKTVTEVPDGLAWMTNPEHMSELSYTAISRSTPIMGTVLFVIVLILLRPRLIGRLHATDRPIRRTSTDHYSWTTRAAVLTVLLAAPIPILVWTIAMTLRHAEYPSDWLIALSNACQRIAGITAITALMIETCRPGGLGIVHFKWNQTVAARISFALKWIAVVYIPLMAITQSFSYGESYSHFESVGRVAFIVAHLWMIIVFGVMMGRAARRGKDLPEVDLSPTWSRIRLPVVFGTPLVLIVIAAMGYMLTAVDISLGLCISAGFVAAGQIAYDLTVRSFDIRRRRLALTEAIAARKARLVAQAEENPEEDNADLLHLDEETELGLDLHAAGDQSVKILRLVFNMGVLVVLYSLWSTAIPLTGAMDQITISVFGGLSLLTIAKSLLIALVAVITVKNLPGLLEFFVLRKSKLEAGTRNAIYTLCQYGTIGLAIVAISNTLQLDWAKLGWMAAALSVGIGFGLQEVVGNFVCGLVVLFERPIRVGDVVTLDGTTGTVTNINMRATTITNWDRQEFVVPNKNLITGTILNWTLNASVTRLVIPIGVAYGTDTELARSILLDVAADHPEVMKEPKPIASFEQFADSSLNLILRAYLPTLDNRISATTELNTEIAKRFADAGIEIPFPQQDLHLRTGMESLGEMTSLQSLPSDYPHPH